MKVSKTHEQRAKSNKAMHEWSWKRLVSAALVDASKWLEK